MAQVARGLALGVVTGLGAAYGLMSHTAHLSRHMSEEMASMGKKVSWARGEGVVSTEARHPDGLSTVDKVSKLRDGIEVGIEELADVAATTRNTVQADGRARWNTWIIYLAGGDAGDAADGPLMEPSIDVAKKFASNAMNTALPTTAIKVLGYGADHVSTAATSGMGFLKEQGIFDVEASSTEVQGKLQEVLAAVPGIFSRGKENQPEAPGTTDGEGGGGEGGGKHDAAADYSRPLSSAWQKATPSDVSNSDGAKE